MPLWKEVLDCRLRSEFRYALSKLNVVREDTK